MQRGLVAAFEVALLGAALTFGAQSAAAKKSDAVQILSTLWKGATEQYSSEFTGDGKTLRIRWEGKKSDGTVFVLTDEASFRFLQITDPATAGFVGDCSVSGAIKCLAVACLFGRDCISQKREGTVPFNNTSNAVGYVNPMNFAKVRESLRTLIRLNAAPPFTQPR